MNILIVTPFYEQDKNIASLRWTNIAHRLSESNKITIVSQPLDNDMDMSFSKKTEKNILVARINQKTLYEKIAVKYFGGATGDDWQTTDKCDENISNKSAKESFVRKLKNCFLILSMQSKAKSYAKEICKKVLSKGEKPDIVITSSLPFIEMLIGYHLKKRLSCKWICDFRDLPFMDDNCDITHRQRKLMEKSLNFADKVFVVAFGMSQYLIREKIVLDPSKTTVISNGFNKSDARDSHIIQDDALHLCYTGALYGGSRDAGLLFQAIKNVTETLPDAKFTIDYAGGNGETLLSCAKKYGLESCVKDYGFLPREQALSMQSKADCLLSINESNPVCTFTAKIFEYMLCDKPIIQIMCGKFQNVELTQFIRRLNLGISVEEATEKEDIQKLSDYLIMQYKNKLSGKPMYFEPNTDDIQQYDYDLITEKIESICKNLL